MRLHEIKFIHATHWGWTEGGEITDDEAAVLLRLGVAVDWRETGEEQ